MPPKSGSCFSASSFLLSLALLGCGSEPRAGESSEQPAVPKLEAAFSHLPLPPNPELVSQSGGEDALQLTLRSKADPGSVITYYRHLLSTEHWRLVSDIRNPDGSTVLYAEQDGPPLWVRIWQPAGGEGTMVQLTGAVVKRDSAKSLGEAGASGRR